ncbi:hypothetical protein HMPREF0185_02937 [Brevundimonas diminuta 470-4]|nr:hypothetical protein HMPREF0185_02937 [Brevundimonas diminuta 470-4]
MGMDPGGCGPKNGRLNRRRPTFSAGRETPFIGDFGRNENVVCRRHTAKVHL